ncbi:DUF1542 domain-containing protein [Staphylococcus saccharolyticus]
MLEAIHANSIKKDTALEELQTKFNSQNELISNNKDATTEEKATVKQLLEAIKNRAIANISQTQSNNQVDNAKDKGMNEIATIHPATTIKTDAKTAINKKAEQQVAIINGNNDATDEEKAVARNLVEKAKEEAKNKNAIIDQTPNTTVEEKEEGNNKVDRLQEEADANILIALTTDEVNNIKNQAVQNKNVYKLKLLSNKILKTY